MIPSFTCNNARFPPIMPLRRNTPPLVVGRGSHATPDDPFDAPDWDDGSNIGDDEAVMWAAYSVDSINDIDDDGDEDDALGIGYY